MTRPTFRDRHRELLAAEVPLDPIKRAGSLPRGPRLSEPLLRRHVEPRASRASTGCSTRCPTSSASAPSCPTTCTPRSWSARAARSTSFETRHADLRDFDMIAFSILFENDYLHVLKMLRMAGIPLRAADRGPRDPAHRLRRLRRLPEPRAAGPLRRPHGGGRRRGPDRADDDGRAAGRDRSAQGHRHPSTPKRRLLRALALRGPLSRGRHRRGLRRAGRGRAPARLAGQDAVPASR